MKHWKRNSLVALFAAVLYTLIFSFSGIAIAEKADSKGCGKSCEEKKQVCFNLNPDRRLCEKDYQDCLASCKEDSGSSASPQKSAKSLSPTQY